MQTVPVAMTIAGSDSGGGAGIQADLKTFAAFQVYGVSAITAVTAQNTLGVQGVLEIAPEMVARQIDSLMADFNVTVAKTGMLSSTEIIRTVVDRLKAHSITNLVVDPVMVAKGGGRLLRETAVAALRLELLPLALVVTPNANEAKALTGRPVTNMEDARDAARAIHSMGARYVVVKGGHFGADAVDLLYDGTGFVEFPAPRIPTANTHGTGCTFASAIAAGLAHGLTVQRSVQQAKAYVHEAIARAFPVGHGHGPLHHFHHWWSSGGNDDNRR